jgi:hypothetical protein
MQGFAAKNYYGHSPAAPQCLPKGVPAGQAAPATTASYGNLLYSMSLANQGNGPTGVTYGTRVQCALCATPKPYCVQINGIACPAGFTTQYSGYLFANYYNGHGGSEPICVDNVNFDSSQANTPDNGGYEYPVVNWGTDTSSNFVRCNVCCLP